MFYEIIRDLIWAFLHLVFRVKRVGYKENVPKDGGVILAYNHTSNWDPVIAGTTCRRHLRFMAKEELFKNPIFGAVIKGLGAFPVHRGAGDIGAMRASFKILGDGGAMLMFPEGRRIKDGRRVKAKPGIVVIAQRAKVPIIPVCIDGKYLWMGKITVTYGKPISMEEYYGKKLEMDKIQELADGVLDEIRGMATSGRYEK